MIVSMVTFLIVLAANLLADDGAKFFKRRVKREQKWLKKV